MKTDLYTKAFQRKKEDFVCDNCHALIEGDGYRNHCSHCLQSKHVDVNPGDRAAECGGSMLVVDITLEHGKLVLMHRCQQCGHERRNKTHREDSITAITQLMTLLHE
jgi:rRNA maturation endonuclease Nob1